MIVMIIYLSSQLQKGNVHKFINLHCVFIAVVQIEAGLSSVLSSLIESPNLFVDEIEG